MEMYVNKKLVVTIAAILIITLILSWHFLAPFSVKTESMIMAVEFNDHAASAWIAQEEGWYQEEGLKIEAMESYVTGVALSSALARGDIQVAYLCLGPAVLAYARGLPIKIIARTHKYGYAVVAKSTIRNLEDLEGKRVGCVREGSQCDILLQIVIKKYNLTNVEIRRMNPPKHVIALITGEIDAAFIPEHYATVAESQGFNMIAKSQDIWPNMLGSVLVVKEDLLDKDPESVRKLVKVTQAGTIFINENPDKAADMLSKTMKKASPQGVEPAIMGSQIELITPEILQKSMRNIEYTNEVPEEEVQKYIDILLELGYVDKNFDAEEILDLRYLE
ncbi:ABC transporter substrate-binding protein [[Eubacterium] cellulosolvens]